MNFSDYEAKLKVENRWMKRLIAGCLIVTTTLLVIMWGEKKYYVYQGKTYLKSEYFQVKFVD